MIPNISISDQIKPFADLTGANLSRANLTGANLTGANLSRADLTGANLSRANLSRADLTGANLDGAYLTGAYLTGAYLTGANLDGADLTGANLDGADLDGAYLTGATMPDGRTWEAYSDDHLAGLCQTPAIRAKAIEAWGKHTWTDCPMHAALGLNGGSDVPALVACWVALYDARLLTKPEGVAL